MAERKLTEESKANIRKRIKKDGFDKAFKYYRDNRAKFGGLGPEILSYANSLNKDKAAKKGKDDAPGLSAATQQAIVRNMPVDLDDPEFDYADAEARGRRAQKREALAAAAAGRELTPMQEAAVAGRTGSEGPFDPGISDYIVGSYLTGKGAQHMFRPEGTLRNLDKVQGFLPKGVRALVKGVKAGAKAVGNVRVTTKTRQEAAKKLAADKARREARKEALREQRIPRSAYD